MPVQRIVLLTDSPEPSGVGSHMLALAEGLSGTADVVLAARPGTGLLEAGVARGLAVKAVDGPPDALARWLRLSGADLVHVHAGIGWEGHAAALAARDAGLPVVRTEHLPYLLTEPWQQAEHRDAMGAVDRLVAVSDAVAASHRRHGAEAVTIVNGVAPRRASRPRDSLRAEWNLAGPVLLTVGRFTDQKNHALLLAALPAILAAHPGATVLLAGDGPLLRPVARDVARRGLAGAVRMLGPRGDVPDLMAAADLLLLPSRFEGLPLVALEAMAAGLPVVATDVPGNADAVEHGVTGWLAAPEPAAFAGAVLAALGDEDARRDRAAAARERQASRFGLDRMVDEVRGVYAEVARQGGAGVERTRIGFIGAGGIAHRHLGVLEQFEDVTVAAVADVDLARATEAAARCGARAFADPAAMVAEVPLDALFICVPPFAHGEPERLAIRHDLPFFVEKPVALDLELAEAVADEVAARGLVTAVGYHWRYLDTVDEVRGLLAANPARLMSGYWLDATPPPQWWWHDAQSGGQLVEQTTHLVDLARFLAGDAVRAYGQASLTERAAFPGLDVATVSTAMLTFAGGAIANFASTCLLGWNHRVALHIFGEGLAIELTDHDVMIDVGRGRPVHGNGQDPVWREDRDFIDAVQGRENRIRCPYGEALATLRLTLAVKESARTGRVVDLAPVREAAHV
jgi:predicted dehydrogenase/glycosyltransferase involved in cell wall biosynthesis